MFDGRILAKKMPKGAMTIPAAAIIIPALYLTILFFKPSMVPIIAEKQIANNATGIAS